MHREHETANMFAKKRTRTVKAMTLTTHLPAESWMRFRVFLFDFVISINKGPLYNMGGGEWGIKTYYLRVHRGKAGGYENEIDESVLSFLGWSTEEVVHEAADAR